MKTLMSWVGKLFFYVMAGALVAYAASRTLHFVNMTLSGDDQIVGYLTLFATTGGAIAWLLTFLKNAKGVGQKGISLVMVVVDVIGEIAIFTVDSLMTSGNNGLVAAMSANEIRSVVIGMSVLIGLNIIATFAYHIMDADNLAEMEAQISDWKIEQEIQKAKAAKAEAIAEEIAEREAEAYAVAQKNKDRTDKTIPEPVMKPIKNPFSGLFKKDEGEEMAVAAAETEQVKFKPDLSFQNANPAFGVQDESGNWEGGN